MAGIWQIACIPSEKTLPSKISSNGGEVFNPSMMTMLKMLRKERARSRKRRERLGWRRRMRGRESGRRDLGVKDGN